MIKFQFLVTGNLFSLVNFCMFSFIKFSVGLFVTFLTLSYKFSLTFMYMNFLLTCMYVYHVCDWHLRMSEKGVHCSGAAVTGGCIGHHEGAWNGAQVLHRSSKSASALNP